MLLLRPKERYPVEQVEPREYFSAAELERATNFRSGQLWLYGARTALELAVLVAAVRLAPSDRRRPVLTGAATAVAITLTTHRRRAAGARGEPRAGQARRPRHAVLGRLGGRRGQGRRDRRRDGRRGRRAAGRRAAPLRARLVGARRRGRRRLRARLHLPRPGRARPGLQQVHAAARRRRPATTCSTLARKAGVEVGEVYEVDASRRTTAANAYVTGIGHTKRVVLYDTLLKDFTPGRDAARGRPRARPRALPRRPARPAVADARRAVRHLRRRARLRAADPRRTPPPSPPSRSRWR